MPLRWNEGLVPLPRKRLWTARGDLVPGRICLRLSPLLSTGVSEPEGSTLLEGYPSRAQAIRIKLGGSANLNEPFPRKPEGMRWSTYRRLRRQAEAAESRSLPDWLPRLNLPVQVR
jgi:hypothetical protein